MEFSVNGSPVSMDYELNLSVFLEEKQIDPQSVVVEINGHIITQNLYPETVIREKDRIEILRFVGGG